MALQPEDFSILKMIRGTAQDRRIPGDLLQAGLAKKFNRALGKIPWDLMTGGDRVRDEVVRCFDRDCSLERISSRLTVMHFADFVDRDSTPPRWNSFGDRQPAEFSYWITEQGERVLAAREAMS